MIPVISTASFIKLTLVYYHIEVINESQTAFKPPVEESLLPAGPQYPLVRVSVKQHLHLIYCL